MILPDNKYFNQPAGQLLCFLLLLSCFVPGQANGQQTADSTSFHFWYLDPDARSAALANAAIADPRNESGIYSNPALLSSVSGVPQVSVNSLYYSSMEIAMENVTVSAQLRPNRNIVLGGTFLHYIPSRSPEAGNVRLNFHQYIFDIGYAQPLLDDLSFGIHLRSFYGKTESGDALTGTASLGLLYTPTPLVSYGLVYRGTGYQDSQIGSGIVFHKDGPGEMVRSETAQLPQRLELGASLRFPRLSEYPDFVLSLSNEKIFGEPGLIYRGGLEVYLRNRFILRGGYFYSADVQGGRVGAGVILNSLKLHYAYTPTNLDLSGGAHQLSIHLQL